MKNLFKCLLLMVCTAGLSACSKDIVENNQQYPTLSPTRSDENAGTWKTVLLTGPTEFPVTAPAATTTPGYIAELNEVKGWQKNLTAAESQAVKYWSAGAVLRWNEILRELVAKHNIPAYQNADGTYPAPSAANPFA